MLAWIASLALEAATLGVYSRRGGFICFRVMMAVDIIMQCLQMLYAHHGGPWVHRLSDLSCEFLMVLAVAEAARKIEGSHYNRSLVISAVLALSVHCAIWEGVYWSRVSAFVWSSVALSHLLMAWFLILCMTQSRPRHAVMLVVWMFGTSVLFYLAPQYRVGMAVIWWNLLCWVGFLAISPSFWRRLPGT